MNAASLRINLFPLIHTYNFITLQIVSIGYPVKTLPASRAYHWLPKWLGSAPSLNARPITWLRAHWVFQKRKPAWNKCADESRASVTPRRPIRSLRDHTRRSSSDYVFRMSSIHCRNCWQSLVLCLSIAYSQGVDLVAYVLYLLSVPFVVRRASVPFVVLLVSLVVRRGVCTFCGTSWICIFCGTPLNLYLFWYAVEFVPTVVYCVFGIYSGTSWFRWCDVVLTYIIVKHSSVGCFVHTCLMVHL